MGYAACYSGCECSTCLENAAIAAEYAEMDRIDADWAEHIGLSEFDPTEDDQEEFDAFWDDVTPIDEAEWKRAMFERADGLMGDRAP